MPTKSSGVEIVFRSSAVNFGASAPAAGQEGVGVASFQDDREIAGIELARGVFGGRDMFRRRDHRHAGRDVLGQPDFGARLCQRADRFDRKAVAEHGMVADLIEPRGRQTSVPAPAACRHSPIDEGREFVDREKMSDAVAQLFADKAGVIGKGFGSVARFPAAVCPAALAADPSDRASRTASMPLASNSSVSRS